MLVLVSLRQRLLCLAETAGLILVKEQFLMPLSTVFSEFVFPHSLQLSGIFTTDNLAQQIALGQHRQVLQLGRHLYSKIELQFSQYLAKSDQILFHQYFHRMEHLSFSKQQFVSVSPFELNVGSVYHEQTN